MWDLCRGEYSPYTAKNSTASGYVRLSVYNVCHQRDQTEWSHALTRTVSTGEQETGKKGARVKKSSHTHTYICGGLQSVLNR